MVTSPTEPSTSSGTTAPVVSVRDLGLTFSGDGGAVEALRSVDVDIRPGEFFTLIGPSGCGKTTLLNVIAGLLNPTSGEVTVSGNPVVGPPPEVGMMFQKSVLLDWRRIRDNVVLPIEIDQGSRAARARKPDADRLLASVGLEGFEQSYPRQLSGGMQQRAAICRMLISDPQVLLLDEPFGALDELTREDLNLQLSKVVDSSRKAALLVTHSIQEGVFLSDKVLVMSSRPGRITRVIDVDLPRPRSLDLLTSQEFHDISKEVRQALEESHTGRDSTGDRSTTALEGKAAS
jgi:NitT/TauT family transport system ATP-binding protein